MKLQIKILTKSDSEQVNELRKRAYFTANGIEVKAEGILWNKSDDQSTVLGIYENNKLISTMRAEIISDIELIEKKLECPWRFGKKFLPSMLLSKAANDKRFSGKGLSSILRLLFFQMAKEWNVKAIVGTMTASSSRIESMKKLGYRFYSNDLGWTSENYKSLEKVVVSKLDFETKGEYALELLSEKYGHQLKTHFQVNTKSAFYHEVTVLS